MFLIAGPLSMEFSSFAVEGQPELEMIIYNPVSPADAAQIRHLLQARDRQ